MSQKHGRQTMNIIRSGTTFKGIPYDVHEHRGVMELILSRYKQKIETDTDTEEVTFIGELIRSKPSLRKILIKLPTRQEDHEEIAELLTNGALVAGSDNGDDHYGRIVFMVLFASEDLLDIHRSSHEVYGEPKDSGRAEMMGITVTLIYICHVIKWHKLPPTTETTIYCDNAETVGYANHLWLGKKRSGQTGRTLN